MGGTFDDEVLELAEPTRRVPEPGWLERHTGLIVTAVTLLAAFFAGYLVVTAPTSEAGTDLVGLGAAPDAAWSDELRSDESATAVGDSLILISTRQAVTGRARVRALSAAGGRELWRKSVDGEVGQVEVRDLPGTPWVSLKVGASVRVLDRLSGEERHRFTLPDQRAWFGSSSRGTLILAVPDGDRLRISRLSRPDPGAVTWTTEVPFTAAVSLALREAEVVERDGLLLARTADGWRGSASYALALDAWTGERPAWSTQTDRFVIARDVAIYTSEKEMVGHDLETGRRLWRVAPGAAYVIGSPEVLLAESMGQLYRLDPYTGRTQWSAQIRMVYTDLIIRDNHLILYQGAQTIFPELGTTTADYADAWLAGIDLTTGRELWHTRTPAPVLDVMVATDLLVTRMYEPTDPDPTFEVAGIDPGSGELVWQWHDQQDSWSLMRLGPRLATYGPDGTLTVWG